MLAKGKGRSERNINDSNFSGATGKVGKTSSDQLNKHVPGWFKDNASTIIFGSTACLFRALHCLAWNSLFSTPKEQLAWRICSVTTTAIPALYIVIPALNSVYEHALLKFLSNFVLTLTFIPLATIYVVGQVTIIVLALILRFELYQLTPSKKSTGIATFPISLLDQLTH